MMAQVQTQTDAAASAGVSATVAFALMAATISAVSLSSWSSAGIRAASRIVQVDGGRLELSKSGQVGFH